VLPFQNLIQIQRKADLPIYIQIVNQLIQLIQKGQLQAGTKLPGSRKLASLLEVNRNTTVRAYEELEAGGWIVLIPHKGAFVVDSIPDYRMQEWKEDPDLKMSAPFEFYDFPNLTPPRKSRTTIGFDDGLPDVRLAPVEDLAKAYRRALLRLADDQNLRYSDGLGNIRLRSALAQMLNATRGMNVQKEQILITRGTIMAIYLAMATTIRPRDKVLFGAQNYSTANMLIRHFGGEICTVPIDEKGIVVDAVEAIVKKQNIRAIYVTSHHHHPTTVTLSPDRRLRLIQLAYQYGFAILEDDYDFDYHYANTPVLPLASHDTEGMVLYFGSFTKTISPAFRVGYLVASANLIQELSKLRKILSRQGDLVLVEAIADLIEDGTIRRHLRKSWRLYKERRDICSDYLSSELGNVFDFQVPKGGLAIWSKIDKAFPVEKLRAKAQRLDLHLFDPSFESQEAINGARLGFASLNEEELIKSIDMLKGVVKNF
jgi:GntR family transcriptional regulator/MocR family aminotransferase